MQYDAHIAAWNFECFMRGIRKHRVESGYEENDIFAGYGEV